MPEQMLHGPASAHACSQQHPAGTESRFLDSAFGKLGAVTDSFLPLGTENGQPKFLATFMGSRKVVLCLYWQLPLLLCRRARRPDLGRVGTI